MTDIPRTYSAKSDERGDGLPREREPGEREQAKQIFRDKEKDADGRMGGCTSFLQRKLGCGYNRAANIILHLEYSGFISEPDADAKRRLL